MPAPLPPAVRVLALGRGFAFLGTLMLSTAVGWELYERTGDPLALGLVGLFELVPVLLFLVASGLASDRYPRRSVAQLAHLLLLIASLGLARWSWSGGPVWEVYGWLLLVGTARSFAAPAIGALIPQIAPRDQLIQANAWMATSFELAAISGPAVAGALIAASGGAMSTYLVASVAQAVFVGALFLVPSPRPERRGAPTFEEVFEGLRFVRRTPVFLAAISLDMLAVLFGGVVALLPIFAKDVLEVGPEGLGWLRTAPSLGAGLMALLATRLPPWRRPGVALLVAVLGFGVATLGFAASRTLPLAMLCLAIAGAFDAISVVIRATLEQVVTPDHLRGRVAAVNHMFIGFSNELGMVESGVAAWALGPVGAVVFGGLATFVVVAGVAWRFPQLARLGPLSELAPEGR